MPLYSVLKRLPLAGDWPCPWLLVKKVWSQTERLPSLSKTKKEILHVNVTTTVTCEIATTPFPLPRMHPAHFRVYDALGMARTARTVSKLLAGECLVSHES